MYFIFENFVIFLVVFSDDLLRNARHGIVTLILIERNNDRHRENGA